MEINWNDWGHSNWTNDSVTAFPALTALAATWNPEMSALYGKSLGEEARYREKDVMLGPGVNIYRTPINGRNFEYMGRTLSWPERWWCPTFRRCRRTAWLPA